MSIRSFHVLLFIFAAMWMTGSNCCFGGVIVALTQANELLSFDSATPGTTTAPVAITGVTAGDSLIGIDYRPSIGSLYGLATDTLGTTGRIYTIDSVTGVANLISTVSVGLDGSFFGVDFNPVADRLRVISDSGQSLRINVDSGLAIVDGSLAYGIGDVNFGTSPAVVASAYTNSLPGAVSTQLFNIDSATQSLVLQNPPNNGTLVTIGSLTDPSFAQTTFDIDGATNTGYAVLNGLEFVRVDLATGATTFVDNIGTASNIIGITAGVTAVPEPASTLLVSTGVLGILLTKRARRAKRFPRTETA